MVYRKLVSKLGFASGQSKMLSVIIFFSGIGVLGLVSFVTWKDLTFYAKTDLLGIFLENRTGQPIAIELVYYLFCGLSLFGTGLFLLLRKEILKIPSVLNRTVRNSDITTKSVLNEVVREAPDSNIFSINKKKDKIYESATEERIFSGCLNHFGYLANRSKDTPIPPECIVCQRLGDCMVATIYVEKEL